MKKIFIVLSLFVIFNFIFISRASASEAIDFGGTNMTYKTLYLYDIANPDFEFTGNWWDNEVRETFIFEYEPVEESLKSLLNAWSNVTINFMEVYTLASGTFSYLVNTDSILVGNIGWTQDDGYIYIIIDKYYLRDSFPQYFDDPEIPTEQATLYAMTDLAEAIRVNTWVITESTPDYQTGYNAGYNNGYQNGYNEGFSNGWNAKETQINLELPILLAEEFQNGYSAGYDDGLQVTQGEAYDKGYQDGANESFIASIDKWLVPAIIIIMLLGGFFAIARKKRDGDI